MGKYRIDFDGKEIASCIKVTKRERLYDYMIFQTGYLPFAHLDQNHMMYAVLLNAKTEEDARVKAKANIDSFYESVAKAEAQVS
jgi:hypothetical protein